MIKTETDLRMMLYKLHDGAVVSIEDEHCFESYWIKKIEEFTFAGVTYSEIFVRLYQKETSIHTVQTLSEAAKTLKVVFNYEV